MPHLVLEHSANISDSEKSSMSKLFTQLHQFLADELPTKVNSCKSRAIEHSNYVVGDNHQRNGFVHLSIKVLPGRSEESLQALGPKVMEQLKEHFFSSVQQLQLQITLELDELQTSYFKFISE